MKLFKIFSFGVKETNTPAYNRTIRLSNGISVILSVIFILITIVMGANSLYLGAVIMFLLGVVYFFMPFLNRFGHKNLSGFIISILLPIVVVFISVVTKLYAENLDLIFFITPRLLIFVAFVLPLMLIDFAKKIYFYTAIFVYFVALVGFGAIHQLADIKLEQSVVTDLTDKNIAVASLISLLVFLFSFLFLLKLNKKYESEITESNNALKSANDELLTTEEELRQNNEELLTIKETLAEKEYRLRRIIENQGEGFALVDTEGVFTFANTATEEIFEVSEKGLNGRNLSEFIEEKNFTKLSKVLKKGGKGEKNVIEIEINTNDKTKIIRVTVTYDYDKGVFVGINGIFIDITQASKEQKRIKEMNTTLQKYFAVLEHSPQTFVITDVDGNIEYVNPYFTKLTGYEKNEVIGENPRFLKTEKTSSDVFVNLWETISNGKTWEGELTNRKKDGTLFLERAIINPVIDDRGEIVSYVAVKEDITQKREREKIIKQQHLKLEAAFESISQSINYAKEIQKSLLKYGQTIDLYFKESFVFFKPKDVVSGDFYFFREKDDVLLFAVADCTGHGVPGAFISMLGISMLNEIIFYQDVKKPSQALEILRSKVKDVFKKFGGGMDIALCELNTKTGQLVYSGAYNPLYVIRENELLEFKGTPSPIGYYPVERKFENHFLELKQGDQIYLTTDGYVDQFGSNDDGKTMKFMRKRFKELLLMISNKQMTEQGQILDEVLKKWMKNHFQIDDITVLGLKWEGKK